MNSMERCDLRYRNLDGVLSTPHTALSAFSPGHTPAPTLPSFCSCECDPKRTSTYVDGV